MSDKMIPGAALDYIKNKKLHPAFSYKDVWNEEHAAAFTVAKAMQIDVLSDIKGAVEKAIENGEDFAHFKKGLEPLLMSKGWWGKKSMIDPLTGKTVNAQLGSDRRLKTIYRTNLRSAYQKGQYDRTMSSDAHPYLMYCIGPSTHHREEHAGWNGLILKKDNPWWNTHFPPNGWGCKCYTRAVTKERKERYEKNGIPTARNEYGTGGGTIPVKTTAPKTTYKTFFNERKRTFERIPQGVTPGFNWNQGNIGRNFSTLKNVVSKADVLDDKSNKDFLQSLIDNTVQRETFKSFVDNAFNGTNKGQEITPVGFLDRNVCRWLKEKKNIDIEENNIIGLESRLIKGIKAKRHGIREDDSRIILDSMLYGKTYWQMDGNGNSLKDCLLYLYPVNDKEWFKIAVRPIVEINGIKSAFIRSVGYQDNEIIQNLLSQLEEIK